MTAPRLPRPPAALLPAALLPAALLAGCDDPVPFPKGENTGLYNPCGPGVAPADCQGERTESPAPVDPSEGSGGGARGPLEEVTSAQGLHWLDLPTGCSLEMDAVGAPITSRACPDCALVLELQHSVIGADCGFGAWSYVTVAGIVPITDEEVYVYVGLYSDYWYGAGTGTVDRDLLSYASVWGRDYYGYYDYSYTFRGELTLSWD